MNTKRESQTSLSLSQMKAIERKALQLHPDFEDLVGRRCVGGTLVHPAFVPDGFDSYDYDFE